MTIASTPLSNCPSCKGNLRCMEGAHLPNAITDLPARFWDVLVVTMHCPDCDTDERMFTSCRMANYHIDCEQAARDLLIEQADMLNVAARSTK